MFAQGANAIGNDASQWRLLFEQTQAKLNRQESLLRNALAELAHLRGVTAAAAPQVPAPVQPPTVEVGAKEPAAEETPTAEADLIDV